MSMNVSGKITSAAGAVVASSVSSAKNAKGGFSVSGTQDSSKAKAAQAMAGASGVLGMDAILALQGEEDVLQGRRRRQMRRAHDILDSLDHIKVAVLSGEVSDQALIELQKRLAQSREDVEDDRLAGLLNEIETRACVELAKRRLM